MHELKSKYKYFNRMDCFQASPAAMLENNPFYWKLFYFDAEEAGDKGNNSQGSKDTGQAATYY